MRNVMTKEVTEENVKKQTEWIVENIMEGYNELINSTQNYVTAISCYILRSAPS